MSKRYARFLTAVFCLFLGGLMVWQMLLPDRERSDVENRTLQQRPALTLSSVLDGSYMEDVEAYVQDQFPLRDQWTGLKARTEQLIGKRLFNNIYLCEGETLISKVDAPADGLEKANLNYVSQLAEKSDIPMYLGLIPSAAEVWRDKLPEGAESWDQNAYLCPGGGPGAAHDRLLRRPDRSRRRAHLLPHRPPLDVPRGLLWGQCSAGSPGKRIIKAGKLYTRDCQHQL